MTDMPTNAGQPIKIMIVGDSMSQGHEGDFTWRYRLWQWLQKEDVDFQFVGPYTGTKTPIEAHPPKPPPLKDVSPPENMLDDSGPIDAGGYAHGVDFPSHHFSVWGEQAAHSAQNISTNTELFKPDYLLVMLGFNDMGWGILNPEGTVGAMKKLLANARAANPTLRFAVANVPQRTPVDGTENLLKMVKTYNHLLKASIGDWSLEDSPVKLVRVWETYNCSEGSYDGLHPNSIGEFQIAKAFSETLTAEFGIGGEELKIPSNTPERPTPIPANITAKVMPYGIAVTWAPVYGAFGYDVRSRTGGDSKWDTWRKETNRHDTTGVQDGEEYQYQVRTYNGDSLASRWSSIVTAIAHPRTAPPPTDIIVRPDVSSVFVTWQAPSGKWEIDRYELRIIDASTSLSFPLIQGYKNTKATIGKEHVILGHRYETFLSTWTQEGPGASASGRSFIAGFGEPLAPTQLHLELMNWTSARITWKPSESATGYRVWVRNLIDGTELVEEAGKELESHVVIFPTPSVYNFEICVSALNGNEESPKSKGVILPRDNAEL
ncbi:fibronectin type III domain-containing protein [Colletotrichum truncatum]|uniref:Fibronectin type III domain-containing protein n=1 Tax=Colletotrichum truncatum TaxID=5467 RepID=A0ACC3YLW7_COLTU|nr:fibronectin type III domain-containing protein [Colletotrichum truncatum]KAF6791487.1 fibronectin type III domain-containing protein [Colletotrichum truncatum]